MQYPCELKNKEKIPYQLLDLKMHQRQFLSSSGLVKPANFVSWKYKQLQFKKK